MEQVKTIKNAQEEEMSALRQASEKKKECCQEKLNRTTDNNLKAFELDVANKKVKELELAMENLNLENNILKEDKSKLIGVNNRIEDYEKEIDKLQTTLHSTKKELEDVCIRF